MGYIPDWQRQSAAKNQPQAQTKSPTKFGVVSKPIFHAEKALHSQGTQTPFTRHYADASEGGVGSEADTANQTDNRSFIQKISDKIGDYVDQGNAKRDIQAKADGYDQKDKGLLGGDINYREDSDGRKFVQKKDPVTGRTEDQRYYSSDDVKGFFGMGKSKPAQTQSAPTKSGTDAQESSSNMGSPVKTAMQTASESESKPSGAFSNVDAAVKSATKEPEGGGPTSFTGGKNARPGQTVVSKKAGRRDIAGSKATSYPLDNNKPASIGNQSFVPINNDKSPFVKKPAETKPQFDMKGGVETSYGDKNFTFVKKLEQDKKRKAEEQKRQREEKLAADERNRRGRNVSDIDYDALGNALQ